MKSNKILKTLIYRIYSTAIIFLLSLLITSEIETATAITVAEVIVKTISYYIFEKIYSKSEK